MLLNLINNILQFTANREPRTANREQSSLNFFNFSKYRLLFVKSFLISINFLSVSFLSFIKESKSSYFFEWQKSKQKTISFFVKKRNKAKPAEAKTTPFRIRNSLVKIFSQYLGSPSLRGFVAVGVPLAKNRSNLFCVDCHAYTKSGQTPARNDKFKIYNDDINNFASLNLVKSFLTSITFDSLSRKIKNPCLVINNLFQGGIQ